MNSFLLLDHTRSNQSLEILSPGGLKLHLSAYRGRLLVTGGVRSRLDYHSTLTNLEGCFISGIWWNLGSSVSHSWLFELLGATIQGSILRGGPIAQQAFLFMVLVSINCQLEGPGKPWGLGSEQREGCAGSKAGKGPQEQNRLTLHGCLSYFLLSFPLFLLVFLFEVLGIGPGILHVLDKSSPVELNCQPTLQ